MVVAGLAVDACSSSFAGLFSFLSAKLTGSPTRLLPFKSFSFTGMLSGRFSGMLIGMCTGRVTCSFLSFLGFSAWP